MILLELVLVTVGGETQLALGSGLGNLLGLGSDLIGTCLSTLHDVILTSTWIFIFLCGLAVSYLWYSSSLGGSYISQCRS